MMKYKDMKLLFSTMRFLHQNNASVGMKISNPIKNHTLLTGLRVKRRSLYLWLHPHHRKGKKQYSLKMSLKPGKHKSSISRQDLKSNRGTNLPRKTSKEFIWRVHQLGQEDRQHNRMFKRRRIQIWMTLVKGMTSLWGASQAHSTQR